MMPLKPSLLRMGLDPETVPAANDAIEGEPCIEDEAIEECVLAEWPAWYAPANKEETARRWDGGWLRALDKLGKMS